jgi:hypothetical protein
LTPRVACTRWGTSIIHPGRWRSSSSLPSGLARMTACFARLPLDRHRARAASHSMRSRVMQGHRDCSRIRSACTS